VGAPQVYRGIRPLYIRWNSYGRLSHDIGLHLNWTVESGPFAGLKYLRGGVGPHFTPKLIGSYEQELHLPVEQSIEMNPALVINIGSAEGYYVVGMARRLPEARVIGFEMQANLRQACTRMAEMNGVQDRLTVRGECTTEKLRLALSRTEGLPLVISDCEGEEKRLLDPAAVPALAQSTMLVELHDFLVAGVTEDLLDRFQKTHHLRIVQMAQRRAAEWPVLTHFSAAQAVQALDEGRPCEQTWLWMTPRFR
jgi:hypothetical protein